eukprot:2709603-Pyramimonas_sp.AAC.1
MLSHHSRGRLSTISEGSEGRINAMMVEDWHDERLGGIRPAAIRDGDVSRAPAVATPSCAIAAAMGSTVARRGARLCRRLWTHRTAMKTALYLSAPLTLVMHMSLGNAVMARAWN